MLSNLFQDHNVDHADDAENWELYRSNVVDFLRNRCNLGDAFTDDDVFHVLGILDVNSVSIHASTMASHSGHQLESRPGELKSWSLSFQ